MPKIVRHSSPPTTDWHLLFAHVTVNTNTHTRHNSHSCFVLSLLSLRRQQQLNFYSFRKIKYQDSLRIDPQLEAATANYWRFRHEHFRRGRPDLLVEIKRMNNMPKNAAKQPAAVAAAKQEAVLKPVLAVDSEVQALKKRIEEMNKNIDQLTAMVEKVNLKQEEHEQQHQLQQQEEQQFQQHDLLVVGSNKRKKIVVADPIPEPEPVPSLPEAPLEVPSMAIDDLAALPLPPTLPDPALSLRQMSVDSTSTDTEFVDQLLTQFGKDEDVEFLDIAEDNDETNVQDIKPVQPERPDPELMQRLSDALMVLPKEIQEMIVERLIQSITSPAFIQAHTEKTPEPAQVVSQQQKAVPVEMDTDKQREVAVPLAAATLAALLQQLCHHAQEGGSHDDITSKTISKILPVVPVHA